MRFKRSINNVIGVVVLVWNLVCVFAIFYRIISEIRSGISTQRVIIALLLWIIPTIAWDFVPSDFDYYIQVKGDFIIIKTSENNYRRFNRNTMKIVNKNRHTIILDDGIEMAEVSYNKTMLKFLKEIEES